MNKFFTLLLFILSINISVSPVTIGNLLVGESKLTLEKEWCGIISKTTCSFNVSENKDFTETISGVDLEMVYVKGGTFTMGSPESEVGRSYKETQHQVTVSDFFMGKYEVTFEQYDIFCTATGRANSEDETWGRGKRPVINVNWEDATAYCEWLSQQTGKTYRLPTEAEWEYTCRAGTISPFNTGNNLTTSQENYNGNYPYNNNANGEYRQKTMPVGSFSPNAWGLYDMHGNVCEWCSDLFGIYSSGESTNPKGAITGSNRVFRGGCWFFDAQSCRSAIREYYTPDETDNYMGFRVVSSNVNEDISIIQYGETSSSFNVSENKDFTEIISGVDLEMVYIRGGTFTMGSPVSEECRDSNETQHEVAVNDFYIGKFEVTVAQFNAFVKDVGYKTDADIAGRSSIWNGSGWETKDNVNWEDDENGNTRLYSEYNHPVTHVSWNDAKAYCDWLSLKTGKNYRLPSEAEWEYACRAGTSTPFNTGKNLSTSQGNYNGNFPYHNNTKGEYRGKSLRVGSFSPNAWGLFDMHGNVWELCSDWFGVYPSDLQTNAKDLTTVSKRVLRGGTYSSAARYCRSAFRSSIKESSRSNITGFRVVSSIDNEGISVTQEDESSSSFNSSKTKYFTEIIDGVYLEMVCVKGGTFTMGSPIDEVGRDSIEIQHQVTVSDFLIGKYEVTFEQYDVFCTATDRAKPEDETWGRGKRPVINVNWEDATAYCEWLSQQTSKTYRLPTEAEWEYACRAGTTTPFNTGNNLSSSQANYNGYYPYNNNALGENRKETIPVGSFLPNAWGLYDMHGNVWEWCSDWFGAYSSGAQTNPKGAAPKWYRVYRGGGWYFAARCSRSAYRSRQIPAGRDYTVGFRVVSSIENENISEVDLEMVYIKGGAFTMGSSASENYRDSIETRHQVILSDFHMGKFEVTVAQFKAFIDDSGYKTDAEKEGWGFIMIGSEGKKKNGVDWKSDVNGNIRLNSDYNHPVIHVSWNDATAYCDWLSSRTGKIYRLPSEAEWEYACRAGTTNLFNTGNNLTTSQANYDGNYPYNKNAKGEFRQNTMSVGSFSFNAWGLYDMHGNVWEWCSDWYGDYLLEVQTNPQGALSGTNRVIRGGCWYDSAQNCNSVFRDDLSPFRSSCFTGFRVVSP